MAEIQFRNCRFCPKGDLTENLTHYSTRHYAHPVCLFKARGEEAIAALHGWQIRALPALPMIRAGLSLERMSQLADQADARTAERDRKFAAARVNLSRDNLLREAEALIKASEAYSLEPGARDQWDRVLIDARDALDVYREALASVDATGEGSPAASVQETAAAS